jgi:hypothetical protein
MDSTAKVSSPSGVGPVLSTAYKNRGRNFRVLSLMILSGNQVRSEIEVHPEDVQPDDLQLFGKDEAEHVGLVTEVAHLFEQIVVISIEDWHYPLALPFSDPDLKGGDNAVVWRDVGGG